MIQDLRLILGLSLTLVVVTVAALAIGSASIPFDDVILALCGQGDPSIVAIIQEIRLPRVLVGGLMGAALALSGAALQGLLRNPLADPGVIGISSSAAFGAVAALFLGFAGLSIWVLPMSAIAAALLATILLSILAGRDASILTLILAGVALSSFATAMTSLLINLSPNPFAMSEIVLWLLGSLNNRSMLDLLIAFPFVLCGVILLSTVGRGLDALTLGEDTAATLGVDLRSLRRRVVFGVAFCVGASVAVAGAVGFIGLIIPHIIRPFVAHGPSRVLLPSALAGAILVIVADLAIRTIPAAQELKLGVVTAVIGAPFFFHLLIKTRRAMR